MITTQCKLAKLKYWAKWHWNTILDSVIHLKEVKNLNFHIFLKNNDLQYIIYTTLSPEATVIRRTFVKLHTFVPKFLPSPDTQVFFNEFNEKSFNLSFDSLVNDKKAARISKEQLKMGSAIEYNSPKYLIAAHQKAASSQVANKTIKVSLFNHVDDKKNHA